MKHKRRFVEDDVLTQNQKFHLTPVEEVILIKLDEIFDGLKNINESIIKLCKILRNDTTD